MQGYRRNWLIPRKDDPLNLSLWRLAPWLAGLQWFLLFMAGLLMPTETEPWSPTYGLSVTLVLLILSVRALVFGGYPRIGSIVLAATNGFLFLMYVIIIVMRWESGR